MSVKHAVLATIALALSVAGAAAADTPTFAKDVAPGRVDIEFLDALHDQRQAW